NFAALVVHYLKRLEVEKGDVVAVGLSGSFPAINIAVYAALETLGAEPLVVSSASASQFGANDPEMLWIDMERILAERKVFTTRSVAVSRGGIEDRGLGVTKEGRALLDAAIVRSGAKVIKAASYSESVEERMRAYTEAAGGRPVKAYINVGGGTTSVGTRIGKRLFKPGINRSLPPGTTEINSVMTRYVGDGVPVIHLIKIAELADRYGFPLEMTEMPPVGQGRIFSREAYNTWLALGFIAAVLGALIAFVRFDVGFRMLRVASRRDAPKPPEQMV
ncbi:MAG: poly-gamma-glutamate system protein, partial [Myxococcales bacterium]|nr:poly-gamma-glutamate system protein [Myxococcales bacterium]